MKVLLTGASGFVGSHVLDVLQAKKIPTAILVRSSSSQSFFRSHLSTVEIRTGSILEPASLPPALNGVTHVIHCAGCTKASSPSDYRKVNQEGTAHLVNAVNSLPQGVERFVHLSSLAVTGPATAQRPATEDSAPHPVSEYGRTKLAGEMEVIRRCRSAFTILRPPAVYGPRDTAFLPMFKAVKRHLLPVPSRHQPLSLVYVKDLAEAVVVSLDRPQTSGKTYFVSSREVVTARDMAQVIAGNLRVWTLPLPLVTPLLWSACLLQETVARLTGRASLLNRQKFAELRAPGWVCDPSRFEKEAGFKCSTSMVVGLGETLEWYRQEKWL